jgi:hypothetical protein
VKTVPYSFNGETVTVSRSSFGDYASIVLRSREVVSVDGGDLFLRDANDADSHRATLTAAELRALAAELVRFAERKEAA